MATTKEGYVLTADGLRIASPGKFEGCARYVLHYWDVYLYGCADTDDGEVLGFYVSPEDRAEFPELEGRRTVRLAEDDCGFVTEV